MAQPEVTHSLNEGRDEVSEGIESPLHVHWVGAVVTARYHNPSILNPDFLINKKIIPSTFKPREILVTNAVANVLYDNGLRFTVDNNRLDVRRDVNAPIADDYDVFDRAVGYVKALPEVPYRTVGLNWQISVAHPSPVEWIMNRFYRPGAWRDEKPRVMNAGVDLQYEAPLAACNLKINAGMVQLAEEDKQPDLVIVGVNFHHEETDDAKKVRDILITWRKKQDFIVALLDRLLRGRLT